MTPLQLVSYYSNLLILQYAGKPKAQATAQLMANNSILPETSVQKISFGTNPGAGLFTLSWTPFGVGQAALTSASISWNDSASSIQTKIQAMGSALSSVTVAGTITSSTGLTVTFAGVPPVAPLLVVASNSLGVAITISEIDMVLPLDVGVGFNILSTLGSTALGNQLNILGKFVGVTRIANLSTGQVILGDPDFLSLIQFAALKNSASSDLFTIQALIHQFFAGEVLVFDLQNMQMSYLISSTIGSQNLARALVAENLLFRPLGVQLGTAIYYPTITTFFGFRTYLIPAANNSPFNTYTTYNMNWPWLSYAYAITG